MRLVLGLLLVACGDDRPSDPADATLVFEAGLDSSLGGTLLGEPCTQPPFPEIGECHEGEGGCHDEPAGPVCRPWCHVNGLAQCAARNGVEQITDRGACICVPK